MESKCIEPDFNVFGCENNLAPGKGLIVCGVTVGLEACLEKCAFSGREPRYGRWVVGDEPVCYYTNDDSGDTFEDEYPPPSWLSSYTLRES